MSTSVKEWRRWKKKRNLEDLDVRIPSRDSESFDERSTVI